MVKHLMIIQDMNCEHCEETIKKALGDAEVHFEITLKTKTVVVFGNNDDLAKAKRAIKEKGYTIL